MFDRETSFTKRGEGAEDGTENFSTTEFAQ